MCINVIIINTNQYQIYIIKNININTNINININNEQGGEKATVKTADEGVVECNQTCRTQGDAQEDRG